MPPVKTFGERIADALVEDGLLSLKQVEELLEQQKKEGTRLLKLILEKSYVNEVDMVVSMGRVLNVPPINLGRIGIPPDVASLVPKELAHNHRVLPVSRLDNRLFLAMADPLNVLALDDVKRITKLDVIPMIASEKAISDTLANLETKTGSARPTWRPKPGAWKSPKTRRKTWSSTSSPLPPRKGPSSSWAT